MYVETAGDPGAEPVLLLHGSLVSGWMWTDIVASLPAFHSIVPDLPGIDRSREIPWESLDDTAHQIVELIRRQRRLVHLVGLSLGAVVSLQVMGMAPELIDRAVLSGALTRPVPGRLAYFQKLLLWLYSNPRTVHMVARMLRIPPGDSRTVFAETARQTPAQTHPRILKELYREPLKARLDKIDVPVLAITGEKDTQIMRQGVDDLVISLPDAVGYLAPGVGHQWSAEDPDLFAAVVKAWLLSTDLPDGLIPRASRAD